MTKEKSVTKNFIFNAIKTIMVVIFPMISFPYVSRVIGVEGVGAVQYASGIISYFGLFASLGVTGYAVREGVKLKKDKEAFSKLVKEILTINMLATLVVYAVLAVVLCLDIFSGYNTLLFISSFSIILTTLAVEWVYQAMEEYVYISIRTIVFQVLAIILLLIFVRDEKDIISYAIITVIASYGYGLFNIINIRKHVDFRVKGKLQIKKHLKPILIIFGTSLSVSIYVNLDTVMLGWIHGDYEVGLYTAAVKLCIIVKNIITSVSVVLMPRLALYLANGEKEQYNSLLKKGVNLNLMISIPAAVGLMLLSENVLLVFSGKDFLSASFAAKILALNIMVAALDNIFYNQVLIPHGREKLACVGTIIGAVLNFILNMLFIPTYKINGAAIATFVSELVVFIFFIYFMKDIINLRAIFAKVGTYVAAVIPVVIVVITCKYLVASPIVELIIAIAISVVVYFGVLYVLKNELVRSGVRKIVRLISKS